MPRPALVPHMRVRVVRGEHAGKLGNVFAVPTPGELLVWSGRWLIRLPRRDVVQAMDNDEFDDPTIPIVKQDTWERSVTTWPQ